MTARPGWPTSSSPGSIRSSTTTSSVSLRLQYFSLRSIPLLVRAYPMFVHRLPPPTLRHLSGRVQLSDRGSPKPDASFPDPPVIFAPSIQGTGSAGLVTYVP